MPRFSAFTPFGILAFSSAPSELEVQYGILGAQLDQAFDTTPGEPASEDNEAQKYATARHLARVRLALRRAGYQRDTSKARDLLPLREADFLVTPGPFDSLLQRQQRLTALRALPLGATASNLRSALAAALGAAFVGLRLVAPSERAVNLPASNFQPLGVEAKFLRLAQPVATPGVLQWVSYANLDPTDPTPVLLSAGDAVTVQGENGALAEVLVVAAVRSTTLDAVAVNQIQVTPTNTHDIGATLTTMPFPRWVSTQSVLYVEVTPAAAVDPIVRGTVDSLLARLARGVTQWATVAVAGGTIGPYVVGTSPLGTATVASVAA